MSASIPSRRDRNPTPSSRNRPIRVRVCIMDRPSRSRRTTVTTSPGSRRSSNASRPGRDCCAPETTSVKTCSHPASTSSVRCPSRFWSEVETRAYPRTATTTPSESGKTSVRSYPIPSGFWTHNPEAPRPGSGRPRVPSGPVRSILRFPDTRLTPRPRPVLQHLGQS